MNDQTGGADRKAGTRPGPGARRLPTLELLDGEALDIIEANADRVLEETGIEFRDEEALALWREAGASIRGERVHFPPGLCRKLLKDAPASFIQHARNRERSVRIGGGAGVFAPVYGPPFLRDLEGRRRYATIGDFRDFVKLTYMAPALQHSGGTICEPVDVPVNKRHLDMLHAHMTLSDKPFMGSVTAPERADDTVSMAKILFGNAFVEKNAVLLSLISASSPMVYDQTMLGAAKAYARAGQGLVVTPFILSGATSPVTVAGTLTQMLAEVMAGAAFAQLVRPGTPVVFGLFAAAISMRSGAQVFATPEPALVSYGAGQLARRLGLPMRAGGALTSSKLPDAQAAYESANALNATVLAGADFVLHGAGWLEGGLVACYEKFMMDVDQLGMLQRMAEGVDMSPTGQAMDAIAEAGAGHHYLGSAHTQENFARTSYRSPIADSESFEKWSAEGARAAPERANALARRWLESYEAPPLDPGIAEGLADFIARRKEEIPDSVS